MNFQIRFVIQAAFLIFVAVGLDAQIISGGNSSSSQTAASFNLVNQTATVTIPLLDASAPGGLYQLADYFALAVTGDLSATIDIELDFTDPTGPQQYYANGVMVNLGNFPSSLQEMAAQNTLTGPPIPTTFQSVTGHSVSITITVHNATTFAFNYQGAITKIN